MAVKADRVAVGAATMTVTVAMTAARHPVAAMVAVAVVAAHLQAAVVAGAVIWMMKFRSDGKCGGVWTKAPTFPI